MVISLRDRSREATDERRRSTRIQRGRPMRGIWCSRRRERESSSCSFSIRSPGAPVSSRTRVALVWRHGPTRWGTAAEHAPRARSRVSHLVSHLVSLRFTIVPSLERPHYERTLAVRCLLDCRRTGARRLPQEGRARAGARAGRCARTSAARLRPHRRRLRAPTTDDAARARDAARASLTAPIYFDLDSDALTDADRAALDAKVGILNASSGVKIRVGRPHRRAWLRRIQSRARTAPRRGGQALSHAARRSRCDDRHHQLRRGASRRGRAR